MRSSRADAVAPRRAPGARRASAAPASSSGRPGGVGIAAEQRLVAVVGADQPPGAVGHRERIVARRGERARDAPVGFARLGGRGGQPRPANAGPASTSIAAANPPRSPRSEHTSAINAAPRPHATRRSTPGDQRAAELRAGARPWRSRGASVRSDRYASARDRTGRRDGCVAGCGLEQRKAVGGLRGGALSPLARGTAARRRRRRPAVRSLADSYAIAPLRLTRCDALFGARYSFCPGVGSNAAYQGSMLRTISARCSRRRVRIGQQALAQGRLAIVAPPDLRPAEVEALIAGDSRRSPAPALPPSDL